MIIATGEREKYLTELSKGTAVNFADVTAKRRTGQQFRPHDYLEAGYAACLNIRTSLPEWFWISCSCFMKKS